MKDCSLFDFESEKLPKSIVLLALSNTRITKHIGRIHSLHGGHVLLSAVYILAAFRPLLTPLPWHTSASCRSVQHIPCIRYSEYMEAYSYSIHIALKKSLKLILERATACCSTLYPSHMQSAALRLRAALLSRLT